MKIEDEKNFIELPEGSEQIFKVNLDKWADELIDSFIKKKVHKQKEKQIELQL